MKVGIIGAGSMGHAHAVGWKNTDAKIVGVLSGNEANAKILADALDAKVYSSYDGLLNDVDMVDICAPTFLHKDYVLRAAKAGCHIICEKPIASNHKKSVYNLTIVEKERNNTNNIPIPTFMNQFFFILIFGY